MNGSRFRLGGKVVSFHRPRDVLRIDSKAEAHRLIEELREQYGPRAIERILAGPDGFDRSSVSDERSAVPMLVQCLLDGSMLVVRIDDEPRLMDTPQFTPLSDLILDGPGGAEPLRTEPAQETTFVAFRLLDEGGEPIPRQPFVLTLPDGRTINGITDGAGRANYGPVYTPGNCTVRFDTLASA